MKIWLAGCEGPRRSARFVPASSAVMRSQAARAAACSACFLQRPSPAPLGSSPDAHGGEEHLVVVGALVAEVVVGQLLELAGGQLLQLGLVVVAAGTLGRPLDAVAEQAEHEALRRRPALVEVDGADDGLDGVGQDRRLGPAAAARPRPCRAAATAPSPISAPTSASAAALTTDARTLASSPSGMLRKES